MVDAASSRELVALPRTPAQARMMMLYVCTTCRDAQHTVDGPCAGARLYAGIVAAHAAGGDDAAVRIVPVECLSVCKRTCAVSFAARGKWTYVFGDLPAETAAAMVLSAAQAYVETPDGIIPWKQRPDALKKGAVARVPPFVPPA